MRRWRRRTESADGEAADGQPEGGPGSAEPEAAGGSSRVASRLEAGARRSRRHQRPGVHRGHSRRNPIPVFVAGVAVYAPATAGYRGAGSSRCALLAQERVPCRGGGGRHTAPRRPPRHRHRGPRGDACAAGDRGAVARAAAGPGPGCNRLDGIGPGPPIAGPIAARRRAQPGRRRRRRGIHIEGLLPGESPPPPTPAPSATPGTDSTSDRGVGDRGAETRHGRKNAADGAAGEVEPEEAAAAAPAPITLTDAGPPSSGPAPPELQADLGEVLATLLSRADTTAQRFVDAAMDRAYGPGVLAEVAPELGTDAAGPLADEIRNELRGLGEAAGLEADALDARAAEYARRPTRRQPPPRPVSPKQAPKPRRRPRRGQRRSRPRSRVPRRPTSARSCRGGRLPPDRPTRRLSRPRPSNESPRCVRPARNSPPTSGSATETHERVERRPDPAQRWIPQHGHRPGARDPHGL